MNAIRAAWRSLDRRGVDVVLAALLLALMVGELAAKPPELGEAATTPIAYLWAVLITAPIILHRRFPIVAVLVSGAGSVGYAAGHFTAFPGYAAFAFVFVVSLHCGRGRGLLALAVMGAAMGLAIGLQSEPTVPT